MPRGISIREFARRDGCSDTLVRRAISQGAIKTFADGTIDPKRVGSGWRSANRRANTGANTGTNRAANTAANAGDRPKASGGRGRATKPAPRPAAEPAERGAVAGDGESPDEAAERILAESGASLTIAEAARVKENYLALLRQLEYDQKSGQVVAVAEVAKAVAQEYARCRTRLLAIPAEQAPRLRQCRNAAEVQDVLAAVISEALEELTRDRGAGAR